MSSEKQKLETLVTPAGIAKYPKLLKPETEVNGQPCKPRFKVTLILDEKDKGVTAFKELLEERHAASVAEAEKTHAAAVIVAKKAKKPIKDLVVNPIIHSHVDEKGDAVDGKFEIRATTQATYENKRTQEVTNKTVPMFSAKGVPVKGVNVGGGSKLRLSVSLNPYDSAMGCGVSLYLNAVQIIDLVEYTGGGSASAHGFGEEEGFEPPAATFGDASDESQDDAAIEKHGEPQTSEAKSTPRTKGDF